MVHTKANVLAVIPIELRSSGEVHEAAQRQHFFLLQATTLYISYVVSIQQKKEP